MMTELTPEQEAKIPEYLDYWLSVGLRTEPINQSKAENAVSFLYEKFLQKVKPKNIIFLPSPEDCLRYIVKNQLWDQLWNQLRNQLWYQLWNQLGGQLKIQLWDQLGNQLRDQLWYQLWSIHNPLTNWEFSNYWHYSFILNEIFPEKKKDFILYEEFLTHSKEFHYLFLFEDVALISDFPKVISMTNGQLNSETGKALEYRDGTGLYARNGEVASSPLELELC